MNIKNQWNDISVVKGKKLLESVRVFPTALAEKASAKLWIGTCSEMGRSWGMFHPRSRHW